MAAPELHDPIFAPPVFNRSALYPPQAPGTLASVLTPQSTSEAPEYTKSADVGCLNPFHNCIIFSTEALGSGLPSVRLEFGPTWIVIGMFVTALFEEYVACTALYAAVATSLM